MLITRDEETIDENWFAIRLCLPLSGWIMVRYYVAVRKDTLVLLAELRKLISSRKSSKICLFCKKAVAYLLAIRFLGSGPIRINTDLVIDAAFYQLESAHFKLSKKGPPADFERARVRLQNHFCKRKG